MHLIWLWLTLYWQPILIIFIGIGAYAYVLYRRGFNKKAVKVSDSYLLMFGGLGIILGLFYIFPITQNFPAAWLYERTGYDIPPSAKEVTLLTDTGFFGDGDQILYFTASLEDIQKMILTDHNVPGFSNWENGPIEGSSELPELPYGTNLSNAPHIKNTDKLLYSKRLYGPEGHIDANYIEIFVDVNMDEVLVRQSDS